MATIPSSTPLHLSTTPPSTTPPSPSSPLPAPDTPPPDTSTSASSAPTPADDGAFENRLSQVCLRYRRGIGKKAELRKAKKAGRGRVSPYSKKINGQIAILGLTALLLVELATRKGVINYHTPAIILIPVYCVAALGVVWIKYEKESVGVWPNPDSTGDLFA